MQVAMILLSANRAFPLRGLVLRQFLNSIEQSNIFLFKRLINDYRMLDFDVLEYEIRRKHHDGISTIDFKGLDRNINSIQSFEGYDWVWIEEAQAIEEKSLQILAPTIRKEKSKLFATWNPNFRDAIKDRFKDPKLTYLTSMQYYDNPFFPEVLEAERLRDKAVLTKADYNHIWEGHELSAEPEAIFDAEILYAALEREKPVGIGDGQWQCGIDLSTFGADSTVFTIRHGNEVIEQKEIKGVTDAMKNLDYFIDFMGSGKYPNTTKILPDDTGGGTDFSSILKRVTDYNGNPRFPNVVHINFGQQAKDPTKYKDAVTEMWYDFRDLLPELKLPNRRELSEQLRSRRGWTTISSGNYVYVLEPKRTFRSRTGLGCDLADSLLLAFYQPRELAPTMIFTL